MDIDTAEAAGVLAARIRPRLAKVEAINQALAEHWRVSGIQIVGPDGREMSLIVDTLDVTRSAQALGVALQLYQGELDALYAQLDAL